MKHRAGWLPVFAGFLLAGCAIPDPVRPSHWIQQFRASQNLLCQNVVQMDVALLECYPGDEFINKDLWHHTDEQILPLERKVIVESNGFRVGQIVGMPPAKFQRLLTSERSCILPKTRWVGSGQTTEHKLHPDPVQGRFDYFEGKHAKEYQLDQAQFHLEVIPHLTREGRTRLRFTPLVEHGEPMRIVRAAADRSGLTLQVEKPKIPFPGLRWEVSLAPNEYLIIGAIMDRPQSMGYQAFVHENGPNPVQHLFVIRTSRSILGPEEGEHGQLEVQARKSLSPPLAIQAALPTGFGSEQ